LNGVIEYLVSTYHDNMESKQVQRLLTVAAAQLGPIKSLSTPREEVLARMIRLLDEAAAKGVTLVVFPELAFTTFFPGYIIDCPEEVARFFEPASPSDPYAIVKSPHAKPLIEKATELGVDISFGYGERWTAQDGKITDYNTAVYYSARQRECIAKYRKVHLPGRFEPDLRPGVTQQLEKRFFTPGNFGFEAFRVPGLINDAMKAEDVPSGASPAESHGKGDVIMGMLICNDRRWAEGWRSYGLQGIELLLVSHLTTWT
jgi:predicted amidohydrolase